MDQQPTRSRPWWRRPALLRLLVALIVGSICGELLIRNLDGWIWRSSGGFGGKLDRPTLSEIQSIAGFTLPPGVTDIHARIDGFQDRRAWVRFLMPADKLPQLLVKLACPIKLTAGISPAAFGTNVADLTWWKPGDPVKFEAGEGALPGFSQAILIDKSELRTFTVYIYASEL